jgi:hypothetical protein
MKILNRPRRASTLYIQQKVFEPHGQNDRSISSIKSIASLRVGQTLYVMLIIGTGIAHEDLFNLVTLSAQQPDMAPLFNYASSAWNNAFFFMGIVHFFVASVNVSLPKRKELLNPQFQIHSDLKSTMHLARLVLFEISCFRPPCQYMDQGGSGW